MKFTVVFVSLLSISWGLKINAKEDPKDKREAGVGLAYPASGSHSFQAPSFGHDGGNAVSVGAGYSIGGGKPSYGYAVPQSSEHQFQSEGLQSNGHNTIQLAPITLQPSHGILSNDLSQIMKQLTESLNSGALSLSQYQAGGHGQELSIPQLSYGSPQLQQFSGDHAALQVQSSVPSYAAGTKGLGSYGSTGPVLFNPADSHAAGGQGHVAAVPLVVSGYPDASSLGFSGAGHSLSGLTLGGGSGHSFGGLSLGVPGHSLSGTGHSFGGHSFSGGLSQPQHAFGGSLKGFSGYALPGKQSFKPSTYLGSHTDYSHGLASLSGSYPSIGAHSLSGGHEGLSFEGYGIGGSQGSFNVGSQGGFGGGSNKFVSNSYLPPKSEGFGSGLESASSFSSGSHSPPATTYGFPAESHSGNAAAVHAASAHRPQYSYVSKYPSASQSFGAGSSSFKGAGLSHSALNMHKPKYSYTHSNVHFSAPQGDAHGAHSESVYNTIKYSEEMKPMRAH